VLSPTTRVERELLLTIFAAPKPKAPHDSIWGHLKIVGEYTKKVTGDYVQTPWTEMKNDFNLPDIFYMDLWPFGPEFIVCAGPDAAAMPTTVTPFPQAELVSDYFSPTVGTTFIEATNGPMWKELHQMLAPGLTPSATRTYHDLILDEAKATYDRLHRLTGSDEVGDMAFQLGQYPFSVIWQVIFGEKPDPKSGLYEDAKRLNDISGSTRVVLNPITKWQEKREQAAIVRRLGVEIDKLTRARFEDLKTQKVLPTRVNASCLLDRMLLNQVQAGLPVDEQLMRIIREK
jgi:cytochrome P450